MGKHEEIIEPKSQYAINRERFQALETQWDTVRVGHLKSLDAEVKIEIERIYKEEIDPKWLPNRYCGGCYFKAVKELIQHFIL